MITLEQQIAEVAREIALRRNVYPKWVESKRLTQQKADQQIAAMQAALDTLILLREIAQGRLADVMKALAAKDPTQ